MPDTASVEIDVVTPPAAPAAEKDAAQENTDTKPAPSPEELQAELERTRKALNQANRESAERRKRIEAYEAEEQKKRDAELSEAERLKKERDALIAERDNAIAAHRKALIEAAVTLAAKDANLHNPQDAHVLADLSEVTIGEDGAVMGADKAIRKLIEARPYLVKQGNGTGTQPIPPSPKPGDQRQITEAQRQQNHDQMKEFYRSIF